MKNNRNHEGRPPPPYCNKEIKVRLDKYLWAARFYTTRALARVAVENGKISYNNRPCWHSREIAIGDILTLQRNHLLITIQITGLSARRRNTQEAEQLYTILSEEIIPIAHKRTSTISPFEPNELTPHKPRRIIRFLRKTKITRHTMSSHQDTTRIHVDNPTRGKQNASLEEVE